MNALTLPFPDSRLSPNSRRDRRWVTNLRQTARNTGFFQAKMAALEIPNHVPLHLFLTFCPPNNRRRDVDNLLSAFKSVLDGVFAALGVDDSNVRRTTLEMGEVMEQGQTLLRIEVIEAEEV